MKKLLFSLALMLVAGVTGAWADTYSGTVSFAATNRITNNGDGTFTTADNAGNEYALATADLSGLENISSASSVTVTFTATVPKSRLLLAVGDKSVRGTTAGNSSKSTYDVNGLIMRVGTTDGTYCRVNGGKNNSDAFDTSLKISVTLDRVNKKYSYTIVDAATGETTYFSGKNVSTTVSNATIVELYSWVSNTFTISDVSYSYEYTKTPYTYTFKAVTSDGTEIKTLATGDCEGDEYTYYAPYAFQENGKWYVKSNTSSYAAVTNQINTTASVVYEEDPTIVYFSEGETVMGTTATYSNGGSGTVAAQNKRDRGLSVGTLTAGAYSFNVVTTESINRALVIRVGTNDPLATCNSTTMSAPFSLFESTENIYINGANSGTEKTNLSIAFDYVVVRKISNFPYVGATNLTTADMAAKGADVTIKQGETKKFKFINHGTTFGNNWKIIVTEGETIKSITRADSYDEKAGDAGTGAQTKVAYKVDRHDGQGLAPLNWDEFAADMADATCIATLAYGTNGTLAITTTSTGKANGYTYYVDQDVTGLTSDLTVNLSVCYSWMEVIGNGVDNFYSVTCNTAANGTVTASQTQNIVAGENITLTATPASEDYVLDVLYVDGKVNGNTFTMPASNVTVAAAFKEATNLVTNGTFDVDLSGWSTAGTKTNGTATEGTGFWWLQNADKTNAWAEMYADGAATPAYTYNNDCYISQTVTNLPAGYYQVSADLVANGGNIATFSVTDDKNNTLVSAKKERGEWGTETYTFKLAADGALTIKYVPQAGGTYWVAIDNVSLKQVDAPAIAAYNLSVSSAGAATLCLPFETTIPTGVKVYAINNVDEDGYAETEPVTGTLDANKPVYVKAAEGTYSFEPTATAEYDEDANPACGLLRGTYAYKSLANDGVTYILSVVNGEVGFYQVASKGNSYVDANRCYLVNSVDAEAKPFIGIKFSDDAATAINAVEAADANSTVANGKFVKNGRIVIVKNGKQYNAAGAQVK